MNKIVVLIPAYNPDKKLLTVVKELEHINYLKIIIINDGSYENKKWIFNQIKNNPKIILLENAVNLGKGAALKTGLNYFIAHFNDQIGIVTADADGQHLIKDILKVSEALKENKESLILGSRIFKKNIPFRSKFGNILTKYFFNFSVGSKLKDTQTGLRGIPTNFIKKILEIKSNGYEFEMEMLYKAIDNRVSVKQIPISAIYEDHNISSHFDPIKDSYRIYKIIFKYSLTAFVSAGFDYVLFLSFFYIFDNIIISSIIARVISASLYYLLNKKAVFKSKKKTLKSLIGFVILIIINPLVTGIITNLLDSLFGVSPLIGKIIAESIMFFINFIMQYKFIF